MPRQVTLMGRVLGNPEVQINTLNNQRFGAKFVEEVVNPSDSDLRWLMQSGIFYI